MHFLWVLGHRETGVLFVGTQSPCRLAHVVALRRHDIVAAPRPSLAWGERTLRPQGAWVHSSGDNVVLAKPAAPSGGAGWRERSQPWAEGPQPRRAVGLRGRPCFGMVKRCHQAGIRFAGSRICSHASGDDVGGGHVPSSS